MISLGAKVIKEKRQEISGSGSKEVGKERLSFTFSCCCRSFPTAKPGGYFSRRIDLVWL
jgi:hypothetical protein